MNWTQQDLAQLQSRGISIAQAEAQLQSITEGFPPVRHRSSRLA